MLTTEKQACQTPGAKGPQSLPLEILIVLVAISSILVVWPL